MCIMRIVFYTGFEVRLVCPGTNMTNLQLSFCLSQKQYYEKNSDLLVDCFCAVIPEAI